MDVYRSPLVQYVSLKAFKVTIEGIFFFKTTTTTKIRLSTPAGPAPVIFLESLLPEMIFEN